MKPKTILALCCVFVVFVIMVQNTQAVTVQILFWQVILPQILLIFFVLVAGFAIGYLLAMMRKNQRERER